MTIKNIEKLIELIQEKETELNIYVIEYKVDKLGNVHFLCKRETRGDYAVWTAFNGGNRAFENFYSGFYSDNVMDAINEYKKRVIKDVDATFISYNGFKEPKLLAKSLNEFKEEVIIESNFLGSLEGEVRDHLHELMDVHYFERENIILEDIIEDLKDLLYEYGVFVNPTLEELQEFNVSKGLNKNQFLDNYFIIVA